MTSKAKELLVTDSAFMAIGLIVTYGLFTLGIVGLEAGKILALSIPIATLGKAVRRNVNRRVLKASRPRAVPIKRYTGIFVGRTYGDIKTVSQIAMDHPLPEKINWTRPEDGRNPSREMRLLYGNRSDSFKMLGAYGIDFPSLRNQGVDPQALVASYTLDEFDDMPCGTLFLYPAIDSESAENNEEGGYGAKTSLSEGK